jgi:hypothetical protein
LLEGVENSGLLFLGDSDSSVANDGVQLNAILGAVLACQIEDDLAFVGELDGVADEVDDHLAETARVALELVGNFGGDTAGQLEALVVSTKGE